MKIAGTDPATSVQALAAAQEARATKNEENTPADRGGPVNRAEFNDAGSVQLSQRAHEVTMAREIARSEPDFRPEVVALAQADLAAGTLDADPNALAAMIARDLF